MDDIKDIEEENEVKLWLLRDLNLSQYFDNFMNNDWIEMDMIIYELNEDDLINMNIDNVEHRLKIMKWINNMRMKEEKNTISKECGNCKTTGVTLKRCKRCKQMGYCSRHCQKISWKYHHSYQCVTH